MRFFTAIIIGATFVGPATISSEASGADGDRVERIEAAAAEFDSGRRAFTAHHYSEAADHFENAFRDAPAPAAIRMVIKAHAAARHWSRAATWCAFALKKYPDDRLTKAIAKKILRSVQWQVHKVTVQCEPACSLLVDGRVTPWEQGEEFELYVKPGEHKVEAGWSKERNRAETVQAKRHGKSELSFEAPPLPKPKPKPKSERLQVRTERPARVEPKRGGLPPIYFYAASGATAVLAGVTTWSLLDMRANPGKDKVRADCAGKDTTCPTYQDAMAAQTRSNVLLVSTGIVAAGTAVLGVWFTNWSGPDKSSQRDEHAHTQVIPTLGIDATGQVTVSASGRF